MNIKKSNLVALFEQMGIKTAANWSGAFLLGKVNKMEKLPTSKTQKATGKNEKLLIDILTCLEENREIVIIDDEEEKPAAKKGKPTKKPKAKAKAKDDSEPVKKPKAKKAKSPGVIASIQEFLEKASESKPISRAQILARLVKRFPDHEASSMENTMKVQLPGRMAREKDLTIKQSKKGFWIA